MRRANLRLDMQANMSALHQFCLPVRPAKTRWLPIDWHQTEASDVDISRAERKHRRVVNGQEFPIALLLRKYTSSSLRKDSLC